MYNLSSTKLLLPVASSVALCSITLCTVLYKALSTHLRQVSLAVQFQELIGCMFVTLGGVPACNVADSFNGVYLRRFM